MNAESLKSQLLQDAANSAPAFSPLLHERIMADLRAQKSSTPIAAAPIHRISPWPYAIAAALSIIATIAFQVLVPTPSHPTPAVVKSIPSSNDISAPVDQMLAVASIPARASFDQSQYANLDQDARRLMLFIADQIPGPPADAEKTNPQ